MEPHEQWKKICLNCWKKNKQKDQEAKAEAFADAFFKDPKQWRDEKRIISKDMMQRLIFLCHPDKHNNSQASTLATEWLLKQRDSL
jgi:hypothetical protein